MRDTQTFCLKILRHSEELLELKELLTPHISDLNLRKAIREKKDQAIVMQQLD
jgi:hypothetical protein